MVLRKIEQELYFSRFESALKLLLKSIEDPESFIPPLYTILSRPNSTNSSSNLTPTSKNFTQAIQSPHQYFP